MEKRFLISISIIVLGITSLLAQLSLFREFLTVFSGNELILGILLGIWLFITGIGSFSGRYLEKSKNKEGILITSHLLISLLFIMTIFLIRFLRIFVFLPGELQGPLSALAFSFIVLFPIAFFSGMTITLLFSMYPAKREEGIRRSYIMDNIGDILGALLFSFIFVFLFTHFQISFLVLIMNVIMAFILSMNYKKKAFVLSSILILIVFISLFINIDFNKSTTALMYPGLDILEVRDTIYGNLVLASSNEQLTLYDNGIPVFSGANTIYVEQSVHYPLSQRKETGKVILISGGISGLAKEILKHNPESIDYFELDSEIVDLVKKYTDNLNIEKIRIHHTDARQQIRDLRDLEEKYNFIIIAVSDPSTTQLNRFYSVEFFSEVKKILNRDGIISFDLSSSVNYLNKETRKYNSVILNSLKKVFKNVIVVPGDRNYYIASDGELSYNFSYLLEEKDVETYFINENYLPGIVTEDRIEQFYTSVENASTMVNSDLHPLAYIYYIDVWQSVHNIDVFPYIIIVSIVIFLFFFRGSRFKFPIFTSGFAGVTLEVCILISFQISFGFLYYAMGLIFSSFMIGLLLGAIFINRTISSRTEKGFATTEVLIILFSFLIPFLFLSSSVIIDVNPIFLQFLFYLSVVVLGSVIGAQFPLAAKLDFETPGRTTSKLFSADIIGAAVGGILAAVVLIPLIGLIYSCFFVSVIKMVSIFVFRIKK